MAYYYGFSVIIYFVNDDFIQIDNVYEIYENHDYMVFEIKNTDTSETRRYARNYINKIEIKNIWGSKNEIIKKEYKDSI